MERPALLVIVRHAESARNQAKKGSVYFADDAARRVVRGTPDHLIELTEDGRKQAAQTGHAIRERFGAFNYVYTSGYARTEQTAEGILAAYPAEERERMKLRMNIFIRERDPGYTYDMTEAEAKMMDAGFRQLAGGIWNEIFGGTANPIKVPTLQRVLERATTEWS